MQNNILEVKNAAFSYDAAKTPVFSDVNFVLAPGERFTILGANGSGKSTLLNCISGLYRLRHGEIHVAGHMLSSLSDSERAAKISYVSQQQALAFDFTAREFILMGRTPHIGALHMPGEEEYARVEEILHRMNISHLADKSMQRISGGERQQIQIARALAQEPELLLLDEPTNHLDYGNQIKILALISELTRESNMAIVVTSHVPDHPILLNSKVGILDGSGHLTVGKSADIVTEENLQRIYHAPLHMIYIEQLHRNACLIGELSGASNS